MPLLPAETEVQSWSHFGGHPSPKFQKGCNLQLQQSQEKPTVIGAQIEFDETGQMLRTTDHFIGIQSTMNIMVSSLV